MECRACGAGVATGVVELAEACLPASWHARMTLSCYLVSVSVSVSVCLCVCLCLCVNVSICVLAVGEQRVRQTRLP